MAIQDQDSKPQVQEQEQPWWVDGWYWPGAALVLAAAVVFAIAPWIQETAKACGTGTALTVLAVLVTLLYGYKCVHYDEIEKAKATARSEALRDWHNEQVYDHCKDHCSCSACRIMRQSKASAVKAALKG